MDEPREPVGSSRTVGMYYVKTVLV